MVPKKKRKTPAAQQLIDSLLDERTPTGSAGSTSENAAADAPTTIANADSISADFSTHMPSKPAPTADEVTRTGVGTTEAPTQQMPAAKPGYDDPTVQLPKKSKSTQEPVLTIDDGRSNNQPGSLPSIGTGNTTEMAKPERSSIDRAGITELKTIVKMRDRYQDQRSTPRGPAAGGFTSSEAALKQSESLRIAQNRITELESEVERLRRENEQLASAGETLRRRADELLTKSEQLELQVRESERTHAEEKKVYRGQLHAKDREISELRGRLEAMDGRLESNFKKIRVRERELEHRLEIVRMESQTLVATKDKMILELKRQIDQIMHENEFAKQKSQEHFNQFKEKQETIRRVVRALRIALTILEGDEDSGMKKPE